ncbi:ATP-binding cassette domain-containing protein [Paenibacillus mucilaginosus]|uniref:ABC transporter related protein n=2 Tax=Paenibacillus mucilaginosus TaxID=61624 RepID=F8FG96_PAEMK|nr:ATP-binding cassette domain-containing protein [Paenibacillus mucilaginosus]AEI43916.1 ABC transporter related protein [Paenibacillus mucilaginosus KNP414]MCG7212581.1 ATP-binding cassette domain-containing protein [Paenibacillus mucilaginosus]WDM25392.1 ATP-binding cassette domain-containing protein [Paenibacillus mucilaginosus]
MNRMNINREPVITLKDIGKSFRVAKRAAGLGQAFKALFAREYKVVEALQEISFEIREGEIVGYIGPNGAGKSTTIKVMSGILVPDRGTCSIMGYTPWKNRVDYVRGIGVVFGQRSQLWWDVPVIDSFEMLRDIYSIPFPVYRANLDMLTETLGLADILHVPVRQLSLGQRMRCEIAASLLHDPKILFLDEPTIGLDAASKIAVRQFIKTINQEKGVTVILTTHDMSDIEALADRILMIGRGRLLYDGTLDELRGRFGTQRTLTADFRTHPEPVEIPGTLRLSWTPERAVYSMDTEHVRIDRVISRLSEEVELLDVSVETKPVDELILRLYEEHQV